MRALSRPCEPVDVIMTKTEGVPSGDSASSRHTKDCWGEGSRCESAVEEAVAVDVGFVSVARASIQHFSDAPGANDPELEIPSANIPLYPGSGGLTLPPTSPNQSIRYDQCGNHTNENGRAGFTTPLGPITSTSLMRGQGMMGGMLLEIETGSESEE